jgi:hypothetical protein
MMCQKLHHSHAHAHARQSRRRFLTTVIPATVLTSDAFSQNLFSQNLDTGERFRRMSLDAELRGLAEPFKGITADGTIETGLFGIHSTGVSTSAVRNAAEAFLNSLTAGQRSRTLYPVDDPEWRKWMNQHFYVRQGVSFKEMTDKQRNAAFGLMQASLSARGMKLTRDIMRLNETLAELTNDFTYLGEWLYHITVMGKPSATEPWGWQFDGHHAIVNYFVLGDQVVMTPFFAGSEPVIAKSGKFKGTSVLQDEQREGLAMLLSLSSAQKEKAVLGFSKTGNNNVGEAFKDNVVLDYAGVRADSLGTQEQKRLLDLAQMFIGNMDEGHARVKMDELRRYLDRTSFAWIGGTEPDSVYYYRIHSPVVLIEFDHQKPANLSRFVADPSKPTREHIHVVVRTPNGNDYGKDLLRQHYQKHAHA